MRPLTRIKGAERQRVNVNDTKPAQKRNDQFSLPVCSGVLAYRSVTLQRKKRMKKFGISAGLVALLVGVAGFSTPSRAETGQVAVVFTKGGFIVGVGGGEGVLVLRGKRYPFTVSGMSVGFTIGASTTKFVGRALNLKGPASIEGTYGTVGAGGAVAAGAGGVQLQNANGVILQLSGPRVGAEVSAAVGGVTVRLK